MGSIANKTQDKAYESATALKEAHARLLEQLDELLVGDDPASSDAAALAELAPDIVRFVDSGSATGAFLEEVKERTSCQVLLDYWKSSLRSTGIDAPRARLARFDGTKLPDLKDKPCPYIGLGAFRDAAFFFGREADTKMLLEQIRASRLVVVIGASGSGKSSLVMGGVLPRLMHPDAGQDTLRVAPTFTPGDNLLGNLAQAALAIVEHPDPDVATHEARLRADNSYLAHLLHEQDASPALIPIDQFEEVFTLADPADAHALVANITTLLHTHRADRVILTVREEFRARIVGLRDLEPFLDQAWYSMRPMGYEQLRAAVERPAALVNLQIQSGVVDDVVKQVLGQPAALPLLQFTLRELWEQRDRNRITWEVYRKVGNPLDALKSSADEFFYGLAPQTQDEVKRILLHLVRVDEFLEAYRQPVRRQKLLAAGRANTETVLQRLEENDYVRVRTGATDAETSLEIKHESLIRNWPLLVGWIDEKRIEGRKRLVLTQAAQSWAEDNAHERLLRGQELEEAKAYEDLSALESEFVAASAEAIDRAQRAKEDALRREVERERKLRYKAVALLWTAGAAAVVFAVMAVMLWTKSQSLTAYNKKLAQESALLAEASARLAKLNTNLQAEKKRLQGQNDLLQDENDKLAGRQIKEALAEAYTSSEPVRIYLHISKRWQRERAEDLAVQLRKGNIAVPRGVEKVDPIAVSEIRYFRPEDGAGASAMVKTLIDYLGFEEHIKPKLVKGYEDDVPARHYEIWFGEKALRQFTVESVYSNTVVEG